MKIHVINLQTALNISLPSVKKVAKQVIQAEGKSYDEATIHFVDEKTLCDLHLRYFNDPSPTDCISFPLDEEEYFGYRILGDLFISTQAAIDYVKLEGGDPYQELTLYLVHGLLHLMGYDDIEDSDRATMREAEKRHMEQLKEKGLYLKALSLTKKI